MNKFLKKQLLAIVSCLFVLPVIAEPYIGLDIGKADLDDSYDKATSAFIYGGYDMESFAVEAGVVPLGYYTHSTLDSSIQIDGFKVDVLGKLRMGSRFTAFAKLGYYSYTLKPELSGTPLAESDGNTVAYGLGVMMDVGQTLKARISYEVYDDIESLDVDRIVIGLAARIF